jgi:chaperone modulatory protein CbpM
MTARETLVEAMLDEALLSLDELCRAGAVSPQWVEERIVAGLLAPRTPAAGATDEWCFDAVALRRVRCMARLERDFDAVPELAALVADLEDEIAVLRHALERVQR